MNTFGWIATGVAIGGATYLILKNKESKRMNVKIDESLKKNIISTAEEVDMLKMDDVVSYFKGKSLVKDRDIPFIATVEGFKTIVSLPNKDNGFILGIYNDSTDVISDTKLIYAKSVDENFKTAVGNKKLIVLT